MVLVASLLAVCSRCPRNFANWLAPGRGGYYRGIILPVAIGKRRYLAKPAPWSPGDGGTSLTISLCFFRYGLPLAISFSLYAKLAFEPFHFAYYCFGRLPCLHSFHFVSVASRTGRTKDLCLSDVVHTMKSL